MKRSADADERWVELFDARACGETLTEAEVAFVQTHRTSAPEVIGQRAVLDAMAILGDGDDDPALADAAVAAWLRPRGVSPARHGTVRSRYGVVWKGAAAALLAAGLVLWWVRVPEPDAVRPPDAITRTDVVDASPSADVEATAPPREAEPDPGSRAPTLVSGALAAANGARIAPGQAVPRDMAWTAQDTACVAGTGLAACFDAGGQFKFVGDTEAVLEPLAGRAALSLSTTTVSFVVAGASYRNEGGSSRVVVEVDTQRWSIRVAEGSLGTASLDHEIGAGQQVDGRAETANVRAKPSVNALLASAREARARGDRQAGIDAYQRLLVAYKNDPAAQPARLALARLFSDGGRTKDALRQYDAYLRRGGPLAEDASYGRIAALRALGRQDEERAAIQAFLKRYPSSSYGSKLEARLQP